MLTYHSRPAFVTPQPLTRQGPGPSDEPEAVEQEQDEKKFFSLGETLIGSGSLTWSWNVKRAEKNTEAIVLFLKQQPMLPCHDDYDKHAEEPQRQRMSR